MYREIIRPTNQRYIIEIPKEYLNEEVEILILPFSSFDREIKRKLNNIDPMILMQSSSMQHTWDNSDDEAWDEL
ncbi:hypothetical protein [Sulfurimonas sp.]|uniref:hypothetical protein n=1 Tax=Sulfurimonas sp. TaxID=2022749 RepID=UPI002629BD4B|nr:hypothetical protein [Sulfurimonas sp.]